MAAVRVAPVPLLRGTLQVPSDKSLTHRALLFSAVSDRTVRIDRPLDSEDTGATLSAIEACRVPVEGHLGDGLVVDRAGPARPAAAAGARLRERRHPDAPDRRPAGGPADRPRGARRRRVAAHAADDAHRRSAARDGGWMCSRRPGETPPVVVTGGNALRGIEHDLAVASAQVKSCILLAGLLRRPGRPGSTSRRPRATTPSGCSRPAGVPLLREGGAVGVAGPVEGLALPDMDVPGDFSSAAAHLVAGAAGRPRGAPGRGQPQPGSHRAARR